MRWIDVCGPPGVGKSTLCDPIWGPRAIEYRGEVPPKEWQEFLGCVARLMKKIEHHPTYDACASMVARSVRKLAAVAASNDKRTYVQTGFAQRGLGIGWRLPDVEEIAEFYRLMPVSKGVAILSADTETICRRNVERQKDRSHMVPGMVRPAQIAVEILKARGVPLLELDTTEPVNINAARLLAFAHGHDDDQPAGVSVRHVTA